MKNQLTLCCALLLLSVTYLESSLFHITVPEALINEQAMLLLHMVDTQGNRSVAKWQLDSSCRSRSILQAELEITSCVEAAMVDTVSVDLLYQEHDMQNSVVVCFELDNAVQAVQILVIKNCFLDNDPFDVVSLEFNPFDFSQEDQALSQDEFTDLVDSIKTSSVDYSSSTRSKVSSFEQYLLYAKIFMLMQYSKAQRVVRGVSSWLQ